MHILIVNNLPIPALKYGGTERVIWWLGKELARRGHRVTYLVPQGSSCPFAEILTFDPSVALDKQIPKNVDVLHAQFRVLQDISIPFLVTIHGYGPEEDIFDLNSVFVSKRHAHLHGSMAFVHNGLDPDEYGTFEPDAVRTHLLFLAKTGRGVKNLKGAIAIAKQAHRDLDIIGGWRLSLNRHIRYHGLIGGEKKNRLLRSSSALLFPVTWDEPFGLAPIEALYHGAPVIATPYGALPEIVTPETGVLSNRMDELVAAATDPSRFDPEACHDRVMKTFTSEQMTNGYLEFYEKVLAGQALNPIAPHRTRESYTTPHPIFP